MRWLLFLLYFFPLCAIPLKPFEKVVYPFTSDPIDVVIPCVKKDLLTLELCIEGIKKNGKNIRRIILLSKEPLTQSIEWFSEEAFPFTKREIALEIFGGDVQAAEAFLSSPDTRVGWILQQLLKFYAPFVIPDISPNVLVLDADVIFLKPTEFMTPTGEPYFIPGKEYYGFYFDHAARLLPGIRRVHAGRSGIAHHMLLQKPVLEDLFQLIVKQHKTEPWKAMCRCIDHAELYKSSMSEYEIYFNFIQLRCDQAKINPAKWVEIFSLRHLPQYRFSDNIFIACPEWFRKLHGQRE